MENKNTIQITEESAIIPLAKLKEYKEKEDLLERIMRDEEYTVDWAVQSEASKKEMSQSAMINGLLRDIDSLKSKNRMLNEVLEKWENRSWIAKLLW